MKKLVGFLIATLWTGAAYCEEAQPAFTRAIYLRQLAECKAALSANPIHAGAPRFGMAARAAFELGDYDKARLYATEGLESVHALPPRMAKSLGGNSVFYGHWVLGRLALMAGDTARAREELVLAGTSPGSAILRSFGPSMRLASDLLTRPESNQEDRLAVIQFLRGCQVFWPDEHIESWVSAVESGETPKFPPSLLF